MAANSLRRAFRTGATFGLTSGVITTLGLIVGLHSGTHSRAVIIGGIITIAIADAFSDALGMHLHEESENDHTGAEIWASTFATLVAKFVMAGTFLVPILLFDLSTAISISLLWGAVVLTALSYKLARSQKQHPLRVITEHLVIGALVVLTTHAVGDWVGAHFGLK
jgi:VIT1/CCC1 family predicted Fe2+/Mn2+ transporter